MDDPPLHVELARQAFEADRAFTAALLKFQTTSHRIDTSPHGLLETARDNGFCWLFRPAIGTRRSERHDCATAPGAEMTLRSTGPAVIGTEVVLRHVAGAEESAVGDDPDKLLLGLLGVRFGFIKAVPIADPPQPLNPEPAGTASRTAKPTPDRKPEAELEPTPKPTPERTPEAELEPTPEPPPASLIAAAESLAAATGGHVFELAEGDPATPLSDGMKATAIQMLKEMNQSQQKELAIRFRDAFRIDKTFRSILPCITELRHYQFIDRFSIEANGGVAK